MTRFLIALLVFITSASANIAFAAEGDHVVVASASTGGTISPAGRVGVAQGQSVQFTISPANKLVYEIDDVLVDGKSKGAVAKYTFSNLTKSQTIAAKFKKRIYKQNITNKNPSLGKLVYKNANNLTYGNSFQITADPDKGYKSVLMVDGYVVAKGGVNTVLSYKLKIQKKHTIAAYFYKSTAPVDLNKTKPVTTDVVQSPTSSPTTPTPGGDVGSSIGGNIGSGLGNTNTAPNLSVKLAWAMPTVRANGSALLESDIAGYEVYYTNADLTVSDAVTITGATTTSGVVVVPAVGTYYFSISTIDKNGEKSEMSTPVELLVN